MPISGVYAIRDSLTGAMYVGSTVNLDHRWQVHHNHLSRGVHSNRSLQAAWNEHGATAFSLTVLEELPPDTSILTSAESRWFQQLGAQGITLFAGRYQARTPRPTLVATPSLRYWRTQLAVPQRELAEMSRTSIHTIQRLEAGGSARLSTVRRLAEALEITPAVLMREAPAD